MTLTRLQELVLDDCRNVEVLPPLGRLPNLESLEFRGLKEEVEEWDGTERRVGEEDANTTSISIMSQLREFMILQCPLLRALPDYVLAAPLQKLDIIGCPILRKRYRKKEMGEDWQKISHIPYIYIYG
ncbi:hypothetical protein NC651_029165 [Populus alba x Populus x berolinensis]|nr:hypothetical protein NC651_029165 [Populus alba x Populus x berolinensis]